MNQTAYRSMRDHIHPPRVSAPSCIIPPADDVVVRPYLVPLLPTFHGMENENPYTHIREFEVHNFQGRSARHGFAQAEGVPIDTER